MTTWVFLGMGYAEGNSLVVKLMSLIGYWQLSALKLAVIGGLLALYRKLTFGWESYNSKWYKSKEAMLASFCAWESGCLAAACVFMSIVVAANSSLISGVHMSPTLLWLVQHLQLLVPGGGLY
jgi:hypothetical protein